MQLLRLFLVPCTAVLLSGCTRPLAFVLFNYTSQSITVLDYGRSVLIPAGGHREISFDGPHHEGSNLRGPIVQTGSHRWFYPTSTNDHDSFPLAPGYQRDIGLKSGYYVAVDERGSLYLLSSASQSLTSARAAQPPGFPLKPQ